MAVKIRLTRMGRKKKPFYRIVVTDSRAPRDGRYIENIGHYNPVENPPVIQINEESANYWLDQGAKPSDTVRSLMKKEGVLFRRSLSKKGFDEAQIADELKKWEALKVQQQKDAENKAEAKKKQEEKDKAKAEAEAKKAEEAAAAAETPEETESEAPVEEPEASEAEEKTEE